MKIFGDGSTKAEEKPCNLLITLEVQFYVLVLWYLDVDVSPYRLEILRLFGLIPEGRDALYFLGFAGPLRHVWSQSTWKNGWRMVKVAISRRANMNQDAVKPELMIL